MEGIITRYSSQCVNAKTLYGLADLVFFNFPDLIKNLHILGIKYNVEKIEKLITSDERGYKIVADSLVLDFNADSNERNVIALAIKALVAFKLTGKSLSQLGAEAANFQDNIFSMFMIVQKRTGSSARVLQLVSSMINEYVMKGKSNSELRYSSQNITLLINTLKWHFERNKDIPSPEFSPNEKITIKLLKSMI